MTSSVFDPWKNDVRVRLILLKSHDSIPSRLPLAVLSAPIDVIPFSAVDDELDVPGLPRHPAVKHGCLPQIDTESDRRLLARSDFVDPKIVVFGFAVDREALTVRQPVEDVDHGLRTQNYIRIGWPLLLRLLYPAARAYTEQVLIGKTFCRPNSCLQLVCISLITLS